MTVAHQRHVVAVSTERPNVLLNPDKRRQEVVQSVVALYAALWCTGAQETWLVITQTTYTAKNLHLSLIHI